MNNLDLINRKNKLLDKEAKEDKLECFWLSFCDPEKEKGSQFLGVIITMAKGFVHAHQKINNLGINPGGEIQNVEIDESKVKKNTFDKFLTKQDLVENGYI